MSSVKALVSLGRLAEGQWGLVTSTQAHTAGVTAAQLSALHKAGALTRVMHGVYRMTGSPIQEHEDIMSAWLALRRPDSMLIAAGATAARLHGIGDLELDRIDFLTPTRRTTRTPWVRLSVAPTPRNFSHPADVPALTAADTIADLVTRWTDLSLVADALTDALDLHLTTPKELANALSPIAAQHGHDDGQDLLDTLLALSGRSES